MSDNQNKYHPDEDDDELEVDESGYKTVKDAVLFVIEVSESMLTKPKEYDDKKPDTGLSPVFAALKCANTLMQQRIISNPRDMMGILLFGTEKTKYPGSDQETKDLQFPNCYQLTDMDIPGAEDVRHLRELLNGEDDEGILQVSKDGVNIANVLFCANQIFTTRAANFSSRKLFLVTDNDSPHALSKEARNAAIVRGKDLNDLGVQVDLFPISHPDRGFEFDRSRFYNDTLFAAKEPSDPDAPASTEQVIEAAPSSAVDGISLMQRLISSIASRVTPRRTLNKDLKFEIAPGLVIGVNSYVIVKKQEAQRSCFIYLPKDSDTPQIPTLKTSLIAEDTARSVDKIEVRKAFKFGGETIYFTPEELKEIKNFGEPVIRIIGFKPITMLPLWANYRPSTYIYPSEEQYVGSTRVFSALFQKLLKDKKMALAWYVARLNASPVIAAIIPGGEKTGRYGEHMLSAGLWVKPLPFADDIRSLEPGPQIEATRDLIDTVRYIIEQLQLPKGEYDPSRYANPALQWFFKLLQALALEEDEPEKDKDDTVPAYKQIYKRCAAQLTPEWAKYLEEAWQEWLKTNTSRHFPAKSESAVTKRATTGGSSNPSKRVKIENDGDGPDEGQFRRAYEQQSLVKITVPQLKSFAMSKGLSTAGKKNDLIDAITSYFETKMDTS